MQHAEMAGAGLYSAWPPTRQQDVAEKELKIGRGSKDINLASHSPARCSREGIEDRERFQRYQHGIPLTRCHDLVEAKGWYFNE